MTRQVITNGLSGITVRQRLNSNFIELYDAADIAITSEGGSLQQGASISLHNGSRIVSGNVALDENDSPTRDFGGNGGIALQCFAGYDLRWENGRLYTMESDGITIRRVDYQWAPPEATDDATRGYTVGTYWVLVDGTCFVCNTDDADAAVWDLVSVPLANIPSDLIVAVTADDVAVAVANNKLTFRMPYAMTLVEVRANVVTAPTGSGIVVDINQGESSILSTKLSIDVNQKTSTTAAVPAVISNASLNDDAEITIDIDQIGSTIAGAGLKLLLKGFRTNLP